MIVSDPKVSARQQRAITALLSQPSIRAAAVEARISEGTMFRWLREPGFQSVYRQARRETVAQTLAILQRIGVAAVAALHAILSDPEQPASARVNAAKAVLELSLKGLEMMEMENLTARVQALEDGSEG